MRMAAAVGLVLVGLGVQAEESQWYGIVQQVPEATGEQWTIGDQQLALGGDARVEARVGPLEQGACAEVSQSGGVAEAVTTRTMRHCDTTDYDTYFAGFRR